MVGILQQLYAAPLVTTEIREYGTGESSSEKRDSKLHGGIKADGKLPFVADAGADISIDRSRVRDSGGSSSSKTVQNFTYSQAYYLFLVKETLRSHSLLRTVTTAADAADLRSGDFVEFEATFRPNAIHALLDILTPDLIGAITQHRVKSQSIRETEFNDFEDFDALKIFSETLYMRAQIQADIARAAAEAVQVDFRTQKTREFYGSLSDITAITICDNAHFVTEDEDRILDGTFTVLGKVTSGVQVDMPILARNKLLDRISPDVVDTIFGMLHRSAAEQAEKLDLGDGEEHDLADAFDLVLPSRIDGPSFRVVPVAIYA